MTRTPEDIVSLMEQNGFQYAKVGVFDIDGILRGKYMSGDKLQTALKKGFGFCDVVLGWDSNDQLYDNTQLTGWHTGYPDAAVRLLPETARQMPFEDNLPFILGEFTGDAEAVCPRGLLRRVVEKARSMGFQALAGCEFEFFLFEETPDSIREKNFNALKPITPGYFGYSALRSGVLNEFYRELLNTCITMDMTLEGLHTETGPGVLEAAIQVDNAAEAADKAALFKTTTKILAQRRGWMATFMAKWSPDWPGQSGHIHLSLKGLDGAAVFHDPGKAHNMSDTMRYFIGGQQALMPEFLAMVAPTVNSYRRLIPGFWAPTDATWGIENRTCALRAIGGSASSQRVEYRVSAADINPYLAMAAALASGLYGIEQKIEPDDPVQGNAYEQSFADQRQLPRTLSEAATRFSKSAAAKAFFGETFVEHYASTREWEAREFTKAITDWELNRYFEII